VGVTAPVPLPRVSSSRESFTLTLLELLKNRDEGSDDHEGDTKISAVGGVTNPSYSLFLPLHESHSPLLTLPELQKQVATRAADDQDDSLDKGGYKCIILL
jgi:hypothetical protein